jgi:hypothetical protein
MKKIKGQTSQKSSQSIINASGFGDIFCGIYKYSLL